MLYITEKQVHAFSDQLEVRGLAIMKVTSASPQRSVSLGLTSALGEHVDRDARGRRPLCRGLVPERVEVCYSIHTPVSVEQSNGYRATGSPHPGGGSPGAAAPKRDMGCSLRRNSIRTQKQSGVTVSPSGRLASWTVPGGH
jgi:hypothetical protein